jgi:hypothetical protein
MNPLIQTTWLTLLGLSLLFVGGFVLWVYGAHQPREVVEVVGPEQEATRAVHSHLVQWFFLYGIVAVIGGVGCLMVSATMIF